MYQNDSFFTLSLSGQIGLIILSTIMAISLIALSFWGLSWTKIKALRPALALLLFWAFLWLSPQIYYLYYQFLIPNLPNQIVIKYPPTPLDVFRLLSLQNRAALADHGQALMGWLMLLASLFRSKPGSRVENHA